MSRPLCIGLTGGIGSGKSSSTEMFSELGVPVIDADAISHEVVQAGQPALQTIAASFGAEVINAEGQLRRDYLRKIIFDDPGARQKLEAIIHPLVFNEIKRRVQQATYPYCIVSSPLLLESRAGYHIDRVLVVDTSEKMQIQRACQRDQSSEEDIRKIVDSQISREDRLIAADDIIVNDKDLSSLRNKIEMLHEKYLDIAGNKLAS